MPSRLSILPAEAIGDSRLTDGDVRVLAALGTFTDRGGKCWPSIDSVAGVAGCEPRSVTRAIGRLVDFGYVLRVSRDGRSNVYVVKLDTPDAMVTPDHRVTPPLAVGSPTPDRTVTQNVPSNAPTPSLARVGNEAAIRDALTALGDADALAAFDAILDASPNRMAAAATIRRLAPGGTLESADVTWPDLATGMLNALTGSKPYTGQWVTSCIRKAATVRAATPTGATVLHLDRREQRSVDAGREWLRREGAL